MAPTRTDLLYINLKASPRIAINGCPGVPRSVPRIETVIELRPINGNPFMLRSVGVELRTIQNILVPSKLGSNDIVREYKVYENPLVYSPPIGEFSERVLGADIPILIPIPKDIVPSSYLTHWNATTKHILLVKVCVGESYDKEECFSEIFPIPIKQYDTLPLYRKFNEKIIERTTSHNDQILIQVSLPSCSFGPSDEVSAVVEAAINTNSNKTKKQLKLKYYSIQIKEIIDFHEGGTSSRKINKLLTETKSFLSDDALLTTQGIKHTFNITFPTENEVLQLYHNHIYHNSNLRSNEHIDLSEVRDTDRIGRLIEGIPLTNTQGFTFYGKLFSLSYEITFKVKLNHGKEIEISVPIVVCPFDKLASRRILNWIMEECEIAKERFGKPFLSQINILRFDEIDAILRRYTPPAKIYKYTKSALLKFGFKKDESLHVNDKTLICYID